MMRSRRAVYNRATAGALFRESVDLRRLVTHDAHRIGADIGLPDVIAEDDEDVRLLGRVRNSANKE